MSPKAPFGVTAATSPCKRPCVIASVVMGRLPAWSMSLFIVASGVVPCSWWIWLESLAADGRQFHCIWLINSTHCLPNYV